VSAALAGLQDLARRGRLYPSVLLHGSSAAGRREAAVALARTLLCGRESPEERPCGGCRHCARIGWPEKGSGFHPDFAVLERDLKTSTSAEATRAFLRVAHSAPFEARGQVFVVAEADTLSAEAGDALLKLLEEPGEGAPRHFLLLAPNRLDLPETLRSRSLASFLGPAEPLDEKTVEGIADALAVSLSSWSERRDGIYLFDAAARLAEAGGFEDPRAEAPWAAAASAVRRVAVERTTDAERRRALLALAEDLLLAPAMRLRGISPERILEGLVSKRLGS
jgi:hypothetical protein